MMLAFVYLFVGVAHQIACFDLAIASGNPTEMVADASHDGGPKSDITLCDHCPTCAPAVLPAPVTALTPCTVRAICDGSVASLTVADHGWLETPPPKILT